MKRLLLALALVVLPLSARADPGYWYLPAEIAKPTDAPCSCYDTADPFAKKVCACGADESVWFPIWFPANARGVCAGGSNDGTACTVHATCTGGGHCQVLWGIAPHVRVNSTDDTKNICMRAAIECTRATRSWGSNDATGATLGDGVEPVTLTANRTIIVPIDDIEAWDTLAADECAPSTCADMQCVLMVRRRSTGCTNDTSAEPEIEGVAAAWTSQ